MHKINKLPCGSPHDKAMGESKGGEAQLSPFGRPRELASRGAKSNRENNPGLAPGYFTYAWSGVNQHGQKIYGTESACNRKKLFEQLKSQGISVLKTNIVFSFSFPKKFQNKIPKKLTAAFIRQLGTLCQANLDLVHALEITGQETAHPALKKLIFSLKNHIENGMSFSKALEQYPQYCDKVFFGLVQAGEQSGDLSGMLLQLAGHQEQMLNLRAKIAKALFYPAAIIIVAILITAGLLIFVVPQFKNIFNSFGAQLPWFTQWVIHISNAARTQSEKWIAVLGIIIPVYCWFSKRSAAFADWKDQQWLRLPLLGKWLTTTIFAQWTRVLATLLNAGIPLVDALHTAEKIIVNRRYQRDMTELIAQINAGSGFYQACAANVRFPRRIVQLIAVGESAGRLPAMLNQIADIEQAALDRAMDYFSKWLEPAIMLILAILTGSVIIAMYLPVFRLGAVM